ncbi:putative phosphatase regulatory subunit-domain-containing protein [Schizophyllum fasciatum]
MLRKKSGEPVRSSLKGSRPKLRAGLSIVTTGLEIPTSKSAPTTPNKSVHFDSKLEHVRLFISAQRPLAVSVDGSPTEDTSGTESDFPSFIFGDSSKAVPVVMQLSNMPPIIKAYADVALEELKMSPDGLDIVGAARVRNLAFEKRVAVRFTFDAWQTTSEVTAKFVASICDSFDRFGFTIRVSDIMSRVVGKTLALALRYSVNGREIWDNNGGGNYVATFKKVTPPVVRAKVEELSSESDVAVLKEKLATVVRKRDGPSVTGLSPMAKQISEPTTLRQLPVSLAARYDFSSSWRNSWNGASSSQTEAYGRRQSQPNVSSAPWPMKPTQKPATPSEEPSVLGSPREPDWAGSTVASNAFLNPELRDPDAMNTPGGTPRRHQRGYFDYAIPSDGAALRRTPPGTPKMWSLDDLTPVSSPKLSFGGIERSGASGSNLGPPPLLTVSSSDSTLGTAFFPGLQRVGSTESDTSTSSMLSGDESTPSIVSPSSGSSRSSSPCPSDTSITSPHEDYSQFLNRFCFFTGDSSASPLRPPMLARTSSSSSISSSGSSRQSVAISASSSTTTITPTPSSSCLASADDMHDLSTPRIAFSSPPTATGIFT